MRSVKTGKLMIVAVTGLLALPTLSLAAPYSANRSCNWSKKAAPQSEGSSMFQDMKRRMDGTKSTFLDFCSNAIYGGAKIDSTFPLKSCYQAMVAAKYHCEISTECKDGSSGTLERDKNSDEELKTWVETVNSLMGCDQDCKVTALTINGIEVQIKDGEIVVDENGMPIPKPI